MNYIKNAFLDNGPTVSVVIPAYNVEKYISRCLDSVLKQSYYNLEVIIVNDCSKDKTAEIINLYRKKDDRIKVVNHKSNRGLFQARISGAQKATGKYLAFIDSDDYVSYDWFRTFVKKAEETNADIVVGEWCQAYDDRQSEYNAEDCFRLKDYYLNGKEAIHAFMEQEGRSFTWSVVWNKMYTISLWKRCESLFLDHSKKHGHMIMWEDIAFSTGLWASASLVVNVHNTLYYYYKGKESSTALTSELAKLEKYYYDAVSAMNFMREVLEYHGVYLENKEYYLNWKQHWGSMVYRDVKKNGNNIPLLQKIKIGFDLSNVDPEPKNSLLSVFSPLEEDFGWQEEMKKDIVNPDITHISFDVFDTLIQRPFLEPTDLFYFLSDKFNEHTSSYVDFKTIRAEAEWNCREEKKKDNPQNEEISLEDIYKNIKSRYCIDSTLLDEIEEYEKELEIKFCKERIIGKELYNLAIDAGKRIIICSDMYLPQETVETILTNAGYVYDKLYLSSTYNMTKWSTNLYKYIIKDLMIDNPKQILHIGDSWESDYEKAKHCGLNARHIAKASDILKCNLGRNYAGCLYRDIFVTNPDRVDFRLAIHDFPALRDVWGLIANKMFGNPYVSFCPESSFNANPNYIGYAALGPHLLAVAQWIIKKAQEKNIPTIHFVARDGYLVKKAFDIINDTNIKSNYIRVSRKAMVLADVENPTDLYSLYLKVDVTKTTPQKLQEYLYPIIPENKWNSIPAVLQEKGFTLDRKLNSIDGYLKCMKIFIEEIIDIKLLVDYKRKLKEYFGNMIHHNDYIFDIGYSGRTESSLSSVLGFSVGSLYIHTNSDTADRRQKKYHCPSECFYQYKPSITGVIREHLFMEMAPSTIGYKMDNGSLTPIFEEYEIDYDSERITKAVQESALNFIIDFMHVYKEHIRDMYFQKEVLSGAYEYYLHYSRDFDRLPFMTLPFEDDANGTGSFGALDFWNEEINNHNLRIRSGLSTSTCSNYTWPEDIYPDGVYVKFYRLINRKFPKGGRKREIIKKIAKFFIK